MLKQLYNYYLKVYANNASVLDDHDYKGGDPNAGANLKSAGDALNKSIDAMNAACGYVP